MKKVLIVFSLVCGVLSSVCVGGESPLSEDFDRVVANQLINESGASVELQPSRLYLIYFSAHWCGPCRKFTPLLSRFNNTLKRNNNFETIFVSHDSSKEEMFKYMKSMSWPAVRMNGVAHKALRSAYPSSGIPHLVAVKPDGEVLFQSYDKETNYAPAQVLDKVEEYLASLPKEEVVVSEPKRKLRRRRSREVIRAGSSFSSYRLTGIFESGKRRGAVISKKIVYKGDRVYGAYVIDVKENEVLLTENGQKIILELKQ